jgi:hypothetical protein
MRGKPRRSEGVPATAWYVATHPWKVFVLGWNWKAALLSLVFRALAFALPMAGLRGAAAWRGVGIELLFRAVTGGFWGSLLQAFRRARPAWLAGLAVGVALPVAAHCLEYAALRAGHASYIKTGMVVSVIISAGSLLVNLGLQRRGLILTGAEGAPLREDLRRLPAALAAILRRAARWPRSRLR